MRKPVNLNSKKNFLNDRAFYLSPEWKRLSKACRKRDNYTCRRCGKRPKNKFDKARFHADHIIARSKGGRDSLNNLQTLCEDCHGLKHPHLKKALESRKSQAPKFVRPVRIKTNTIYRNQRGLPYERR